MGNLPLGSSVLRNLNNRISLNDMSTITGSDHIGDSRLQRWHLFLGVNANDESMMSREGKLVAI
jgi:hypothetical protein